MFVQDENGEIPFHNAIRCAAETLQDKIITSDTDLLGICFFGTVRVTMFSCLLLLTLHLEQKKKQNINDLEGIYTWQDLDVPDAEKILALEELRGAWIIFSPSHLYFPTQLLLSLLEHDIESELGTYTGDSRVAEALWVCSSMFGNLSIKVGSKRIFLFTNEPNPYAKQDGLAQKAKQRARDVADNGIEIEPFFSNRAGDDRFDIRLFYRDVLTLDEDGDDDTASQQFNISLRYEELKAKVLRKAFKKRSQGRISFWIGNGSSAA